jgi:hypothetical protein
MDDINIKEEFVKAKIVLPKGVIANDVMMDVLFTNFKEAVRTAERLAKIEALEELKKEVGYALIDDNENDYQNGRMTMAEQFMSDIEDRIKALKAGN